MITLYVFPPSPRAFKVRVTATHLDIAHEVRIVDLTKGEQNAPEFAALNPNRRMPVLVEDDFVLWESNAIMQYLASKRPASGMWPADPRRNADVSRWQCWDLAHWDPACATVIYERLVKKALGLGEPDPAEIAKGEERFQRCAQVLDAHLEGRRYVAGDELTVADFSIGAALNIAPVVGLPVAPYTEIQRWYRALAELPAWRASLAELPARR